MTEFVLVLLVLFFGTVAALLAYDRFRTRRRPGVSSQYVQALIDLLDGKQESAFSRLRQVVAEDSSNIDAYLRLGQILRDNNSPERALQVHKDLTLRVGLSRDDKKAVLKQLALDYLALDDRKTTERALKEVIALDAGDRWAHTTLLRLLEDARNWDEAYRMAEQILRIESSKSKKPLAQYKYKIGRDLFNKREFHKARIVLKEAIGLDPTFVPAYLAIGDSYCEEDRFEDAVTFWNKLIATVPGQGHLAIDRLKRTLFDLGRFGEIVRICESILEHDPKNIEARRTLAEFHQKKGDLNAAAEVLQSIIDDHPEDLASVLELSSVLLEKGDTKRVADVLRRFESDRERRAGDKPIKPTPLPGVGA
jgi:lipopolysaccharide biosynthesis regulator YciM